MKIPGPLQHQPFEVFCMRAGLAALFYFQGLPDVSNFSKQPAPVGLGRWIDFTFFADPQFMQVCKPILGVMLCLYVLGRFTLVTLTFMTFVTVGLGTLFNSQHAIGHSFQPLSLVIVVQWLFACVSALGRVFHWTPSAPVHDLEIYYSKQTLAAVYMASAITKLTRSEGGWLLQLPSIVVQLQKTQEQYFYDRLKPLGDDWLASFTNLLLQHPGLTYVCFGAGLFLELFAFLALFGRTWGLLMGIALLTMHYLADQVMGLSFTILCGLVAIYFVNPAYWLLKIAKFEVPWRPSDPPVPQPAAGKLSA